MKNLFVVFILIAAVLFGQDVKYQDINLRIDVQNKIITVNGIMEIDFQGKDSVDFVIWKNSTVKSIETNGRPLNYYFDTISVSPMMYVPNGRKLTIYNLAGKLTTASINFSYESDMKDLSDWANSFSDEWIELNYYCAWYPVCVNGSGFKSKINISIDKDYKISGSGKVSRNEYGWEMVQPWDSFDNVVIASNNLQSKILDEDNVYIRTDYCELQNSDSILTECRYILNLFENYFGKKDSSYLKFVFAPFAKGGGYSRKNFVCLRRKIFDKNTRAGIAHETAHFWWTGANTSTWEDWLNESFAEYSMLIYIRERFGYDEFEKKIEKYRNDTKDLPAVWGIERNSNDAYPVLYEKGSVILFEFEKKVGQGQFTEFLKELINKNVKTTEKLLILVEKHFTPEIKSWLENKLKTA